MRVHRLTLALLLGAWVPAAADEPPTPIASQTNTTSHITTQNSLLNNMIEARQIPIYSTECSQPTLTPSENLLTPIDTPEPDSISSSDIITPSQISLNSSVSSIFNGNLTVEATQVLNSSLKEAKQLNEILRSHTAEDEEEEEEEEEEDPVEENGDQFLSFEEWKKAKGVASAQDKSNADGHANRLKTKPVGTSDAIGEEMEIDISNFFSPQEPEGRIYKDKFNFASFDCAATIVKTNSEAKGATSILFENKDSYLLNPCSAPNQFVVIELCQDILVDSVVLGNFEFFSSTFKKVRFSVSETFPVPHNGWKVLGEMPAKDIRDVQTFNISNPMIWAKYFRVEILEHYGKEYYCPLSLLRVHGRTMMQEYKQEEARQNSQDEITHAVPVEHQNQPTVGKENDGVSVECAIEQDCTDISPNIVTDLNEAVVEIDAELRNDLTKWNDFEECAVTLPQLTLQELFRELQSNTSCDPAASSTLTTNIPAPNTSGTQESIYKNIMKRLSVLEANATLSVLYIEEQSKHISNAFSSLEKRHSKKLEGLMQTFNSTIHSQIEGLASLYDIVQRRTDDMFSRQREQHDQMLNNSNKRLSQLESELQFQKLVNFINVIILICLLLYVILTRDTFIDTDWTDANAIPNNPKHRVISKSRIKTNFDNLKRYYYNSDGASTKSNGSPSDEEDSGRETPSSQDQPVSLPKVRIDPSAFQSHPPNEQLNGENIGTPRVERPMTPEHSDSDQ